MKNSNINNSPLGEDFYSFHLEEKEINPKDISKIKVSNKKDKKVKNKDINVDVPDKDLKNQAQNLINNRKILSKKKIIEHK